MQGPSIEGSGWAVLGKVGLPDLYACQVSQFNDKGKAQLKLAVPDLSKFEFNSSSDYQNNCSEWQEGADFLLCRKPRGGSVVKDKTEFTTLIKKNHEEFSVRPVITPISLPHYH